MPCVCSLPPISHNRLDGNRSIVTRSSVTERQEVSNYGKNNRYCSCAHVMFGRRQYDTDRCVHIWVSRDVMSLVRGKTHRQRVWNSKTSEADLQSCRWITASAMPRAAERRVRYQFFIEPLNEAVSFEHDAITNILMVSHPVIKSVYKLKNNLGLNRIEGTSYV